MIEIVMSPDLLFAPRAPRALDNGIMVQRVGKDKAIRQKRCNCRNAGEIGNPSGGEDERGLLAVEVGELSLQFDYRRCVPEMLRVPPAPAPCRRAA